MIWLLFNDGTVTKLKFKRDRVVLSGADLLVRRRPSLKPRSYEC